MKRRRKNKNSPERSEYNMQYNLFHDAIRSQKKAVNINKSIIISIVALMVSLCNIMFSIQPNLIPWNMNVEQRALAGNLDAQMYLGNHYYQIKQYGQSIRFYDMAIENAKRNKNSYYLAIAKNNSAHFYACGVGVDQNWEKAYYIYHSILEDINNIKRTEDNEEVVSTILHNITISDLAITPYSSISPSFDIILTYINYYNLGYTDSKLADIEEKGLNAIDLYTFLCKTNIITPGTILINSGEDVISREEFFVFLMERKILRRQIDSFLDGEYEGLETKLLRSKAIPDIYKAISDGLIGKESIDIKTVFNSIDEIYSLAASFDYWFDSSSTTWPDWYYAEGNEFEGIKRHDVILTNTQGYKGATVYRVYGILSDVAESSIIYIDNGLNESLFVSN